MRDLWNARFSQDKSVYGLTPNQFLADELELLAPGSLLLPAEGQGRNAIFAANLGWQVHAFDFSEVARDQALAFAAAEEVDITYDIMDYAHLQLPAATYDAAALIYAHTPPGLRTTVHQAITHSLKTGGYLMLEAFHKEQLGRTSGGPKRSDMLFDEEELTADFAQLEIISMEKKLVVLDEGPLHSGEAVVIRVLARKSQEEG